MTVAGTRGKSTESIDRPLLALLPLIDSAGEPTRRAAREERLDFFDPPSAAILGNHATASPARHHVASSAPAVAAGSNFLRIRATLLRTERRLRCVGRVDRRNRVQPDEGQTQDDRHKQEDCRAQRYQDGGSGDTITDVALPLVLKRVTKLTAVLAQAPLVCHENG
jgi:hypothetical protein